MLPKEIIENEIANKLKAKPEKTSGINAIVEIELSGTNGGIWTIDCTKPGGDVVAGPSGNAGVAIVMLDTDFVDIYQGTLSPQKAFLTGKIKVKGDMGLALKLGNIL